MSWTETFHGGGVGDEEAHVGLQAPCQPGLLASLLQAHLATLGSGLSQSFTAHGFAGPSPASPGSQTRQVRKKWTESGPGLISVHAEQVPSIPEANSRFPETTADSGAECRSASSPDPMATPLGSRMWGRRPTLGGTQGAM